MREVGAGFKPALTSQRQELLVPRMSCAKSKCRRDTNFGIDFYFAFFALFAVRKSELRLCLDKAMTDLVAFHLIPRATKINVYQIAWRGIWRNFGI